MTTPKRQLYFDNHATTPVDPRVLKTMLPYFSEKFGNAESGQHTYGWEAKAAVDRARAQVAKLLNAEAGEIVFNSGATESIHSAILGYLETQEPRRHLITSNAEHKATLEVCQRAKRLGHEVSVLPVNRHGQVEVPQILAALRPDTALVSLLHGNNEIGSLNPVAEVGSVLRERGVVFHVDAAQTAGKLPIDVRAMNIDLLSMSSHKLYGPKGVGALFVRRLPMRLHLASYIVGGGQERGMRGGTVNVPGVVGFGEACEIAVTEMNQESARITGLRDHLIRQATRLPGVQLNGHPTKRLCNNVSLTIRGIGNDDLLMGLKGVAYSSASACSTGTASHVLQAIGQETGDPLITTVRFGLGRFTTTEDVEDLIRLLRSTIGVGSTNAGTVSKG